MTHEQKAGASTGAWMLQHARLGERFDAEQPAAQERAEPIEFQIRYRDESEWRRATQESHATVDGKPGWQTRKLYAAQPPATEPAKLSDERILAMASKRGIDENGLIGTGDILDFAKELLTAAGVRP